LFGVLFIIVCGSLLIVISNVLPFLAEKRQMASSNPLWRHRKEEWTTNDVLHLQKIALDGHGIGPWTDEETQVPLLRSNNEDVRHFKLPWLARGDREVNPFAYRANEESDIYKDNFQMQLL